MTIIEEITEIITETITEELKGNFCFTIGTLGNIVKGSTMFANHAFKMSLMTVPMTFIANRMLSQPYNYRSTILLASFIALPIAIHKDIFKDAIALGETMEHSVEKIFGLTICGENPKGFFDYIAT